MWLQLGVLLSCGYIQFLGLQIIFLLYCLSFFGKGHSLLDQVAFNISVFLYPTTNSVPVAEVLFGLALWEGPGLTPGSIRCTKSGLTSVLLCYYGYRTEAGRLETASRWGSWISSRKIYGPCVLSTGLSEKGLLTGHILLWIRNCPWWLEVPWGWWSFNQELLENILITSSLDLSSEGETFLSSSLQYEIPSS